MAPLDSLWLLAWDLEDIRTETNGPNGRGCDKGEVGAPLAPLLAPLLAALPALLVLQGSMYF